MIEVPNFVTFFSQNYITMGLTLIDSIVKSMPNSKVYVLPLDAPSIESIARFSKENSKIITLGNSEIISLLNEFENAGRTRAEAIFTVKPRIIELALEKSETNSMLIYCDADIFFFRELPNELLIDKDVLLSEHIFHTELLGHLRYGLYNAGFVGFRNNRMGQAKLKWWRIKCFEKCSKIPDEQTFADQKYLEQVADRSTRTGVIREFVVNQSIWAWDESTTVEVGPTVNSLPLVCFHFHGVRLLRSGIYTDLHRYGNTFNKEAVFTLIYSPYKSALKSNLNYHGELPREIGKSLLRRKYGFMPW